MYYILFVSLLAAAFGAQCPPAGDPFYFLPHESDCSKFYICAHGIPVLQTCPDGTHFSPNHNVCQNPVFAGCDATLPALCPDWSMVMRPHPDSCSQYYVCLYGEVKVFDCPAGLEFNAEIQECVWPAESGCSIAPTEGTQTDASQDVQNGGQDVQNGGQDGACEQDKLSPHEECSKYYVCDNGVEVAMDCPAGLLWNSELSQCVWPAESSCSVAPPEGAQTDSSLSEEIQNGGQDGCESGALSPNEDCSKYNVCDNGVQVALDCPGGLHWNSELLYCDWPVSAGCQK